MTSEHATQPITWNRNDTAIRLSGIHSFHGFWAQQSFTDIVVCTVMPTWDKLCSTLQKSSPSCACIAPQGRVGSLCTMLHYAQEPLGILLNFNVNRGCAWRKTHSQIHINKYLADRGNLGYSFKHSCKWQSQCMAQNRLADTWEQIPCWSWESSCIPLSIHANGSRSSWCKIGSQIHPSKYLVDRGSLRVFP